MRPVGMASTLASAMGGEKCISNSGVSSSKLVSNSSRESLMIVIYPAPIVGRHLLMSPPYLHVFKSVGRQCIRYLQWHNIGHYHLFLSLISKILAITEGVLFVTSLLCVVMYLGAEVRCDFVFLRHPFYRSCALSQLDLNKTWWRHRMGTFSALLAICAGNSSVTGEFQRAVTRSFDVFFALRLNKLLSKQSWGWWLETPLCPLWRHSNDGHYFADDILKCMLFSWRFILYFA